MRALCRHCEALIVLRVSGDKSAWFDADGRSYCARGEDVLMHQPMPEGLRGSPGP